MKQATLTALRAILESDPPRTGADHARLAEALHLNADATAPGDRLAPPRWLVRGVSSMMGLRPMRSWTMIGAWGYDAPGCFLSSLRLEQGKPWERLERSTGGKAWRFDALAGQKVLPARMREQTFDYERTEKY